MMNGKILAYSETVSAGVIEGHDGKSYHFNKSTWLSGEIKPEKGLLVKFNPARRAASDVSIIARKASL